MRRPVSRLTFAGVMFTLLLIGTLFVAFNVRPARSSPATIIVPDDYPTIRAAMNNASDGDTIFIRNGTYYENVVVNKQVKLLGENRIGTIINANVTGIVLNIVANNVSVSGFTLEGSGSTYPDSGVLLQNVANCRIFENRMNENLGDGIFLISCSNNVVFGNEVVGNDVDGISVSGSTSNTISDNNVTGNGWSGIGLFGYSSENSVTSNNVANNPEGIAVVISARNEISGNTIVSNSNWGISIYQSLNNSIFHNEFNNSLQVNSDGSPNMWDNGYPSGGNYWSDYHGNDSFSGPYQNATGSDGIGDTPYVVDANNTDRYPLMSPWKGLVGDVNIDGKVDGRDIAIVARAFGSIPGDPRWNALADVNDDGKIDGRDIVIVAKHFGEG
jgi:parallel beta-helix repeat protein